jgi:hypothetical protein
VEKNKKIISFMKKPKKVQMRDQEQIFNANRVKRENFLKEMKNNDRKN